MFSGRFNFVYLCLTLAFGVFILTPTVNFQFFLSSGDHGQNLYAFQKTLEGQWPYRDYWWEYGPLMPAYYATFYKLLGINIQSVLLGKAVLQLLSGLFAYLALARFLSPAAAFISTIWLFLFTPDFFYTYNHIGGMCVLMMTLYAVSLYIIKPKRAYVYTGLLTVFVLLLIKINIGLFAFLALALSLLMIDKANKNPYAVRQKYFYLASAFVLLSAGLIYGLLIYGLPSDIVRQSFPHLTAYYLNISSIGLPISTFWNYMLRILSSSWQNIILGAIVIFSIVQTAYSILRAHPVNNTKNIFLFMGILMIFSIGNLHEFVASSVLYRSTWAIPFMILMMCTFVFTGTSGLPKMIKVFFSVILVIFSCQNIFNQHRIIKQFKAPEHYLGFNKAKIYAGNSVEWIETVKATAGYLKSHLADKEKFLALPYDPLYYFLLEKSSPTRDLIFFDYVHVQPRQEQTLIDVMEKEKINYVLLSSRIKTGEPGLGVFGQTYCPLLEEYIKNHFTEVAVFGDWQNEPGWAWNHGTKILKRIQK